MMAGRIMHRPLTSFLVVLLLSSCAAGPTQAQSVADSIQQALSPEQLREYRRQRLSVQIETETQRTVEITGDRYYNYFTGGTTTRRTVRQSGETFKTWMPYRGFQRISEPDFFEIAGYTRQARRAQAAHTNRKPRLGTLTWVGGAVAAPGGVFVAAGEREVGPWFLAAGGLMMLIDLITPSVEEYNPGPPMWAPASKVHGIAGEYNRQLFRELKEARAAATDRPSPEERQRVEDQRRAESRERTEARSPQPSAARFPVATAAVASNVEDALSLPSGARKAMASAGDLQEGDVITAAGGEALSRPGQLDQIVERHGAGDKLKLEVLREGDSRTFSVTLGEGRSVQASPASEETIVQLPVEVTDVAADLKEALSLPKGARKVTTEGRTNPAKNDLQGGDIITAVEGRDLSVENTLRQILQRHEAGERLTVTVLRGGKSRTVSVVLENGR
jgi:hypothetical protein